MTNYVDLNATRFEVEYLQMQAPYGDSLYNIFDNSLTPDWMNQRFIRMGMKWVLREGQISLRIQALPTDQADILKAYVDSTVTNVEGLIGNPRFVYHLYAVDRFETGGAVNPDVGGQTLWPDVWATFIPVGTGVDYYYNVADSYMAKNLTHELGHLRIMLSEYCKFPGDHIVSPDSVCVMSDICYNGNHLWSWCTGNCGSQYQKLAYEFCSECSTKIRNAYLLPGSMVP